MAQLEENHTMVIDAEGKARVTLIFDSEAEKARYDAVRPSNAGADFWTVSGAKAAEREGFDCPVTIIARGGFGLDDAEMERSIALVIKSGERQLRNGKDRLSADLTFCFRIGFRSRCRVAKEAFLSQFDPRADLSLDDLIDADPELALARMDGEGAGRKLAEELVRVIRDEDATALRALVPTLQAAEEGQAQDREREGMPAAEVAHWRIGFSRVPNPWRGPSCRKRRRSRTSAER